MKESRSEPTEGDAGEETGDDTEVPVCPNCLSANDPAESFCIRCGAPIGLVAALDPMQKILAEGFVYRQAVDGPPKRIILIGIWLLFLPQFAVSVLYFRTLRELPWMDTSGRIPEILTLLHGLFCLVILGRATANHFRPRPDAGPGAP